ncbi:ADP-ribosylglycohydrolase family protein [Bosea sp. NBC_00550]|nr:ADP-ribosylglycohydrolase family protein [Bosea sp. NBC_00550]UZF93027.1 ADP-ribosylglycohydrolase family protein [Bosea sp. NBC_00550]
MNTTAPSVPFWGWPWAMPLASGLNSGGATSTRTDYSASNWLSLPPGYWTDDTALALALAQTLIAGEGKLDPMRLAGECAGYMQHGKHHPAARCVDIGGTTSGAVSAFLATGQPVGPHHEHSSGNGSLMRLAPVSIVTTDPDRAAHLAREQSRVTHASPACLDACELLARMLVAAIATGDKNRTLDACGTRSFADPDIEALARGVWGKLSRDDIRSGGYVVDTLCASLWSVGTTDRFEDAVTLAVNLAGDADTTGAVTGMLAGAIYGVSSIPERFLTPLLWREHLTDVGEKLFRLRSSDPSGCSSRSNGYQ